MRSAPQPEKFFRRLGYGLFALAGLALLLQAAAALRLENELTQVESIILVQARMLAQGQGLYTDLNAYPYTVSPYGPIFYAAVALLSKAGVPAYVGGRSLSLIALAAVVLLGGRITQRLTGDRWAAATAMLLAAGTANLVKWGTTAQTDMAALAFALAAFERYTAWAENRRVVVLAWAGVFAALAIFTKQSFLAAATAITFLALARDRKRGLVFGGSLAAAGVIAALAVDGLTGGYLDHGIRANLNPFAWSKITDQARYFALVAAPLALVALAPAARFGVRFFSGLHVYLLLAFLILCATAGKLGSDLNYQLEVFALLSIASGVALHRLDFFKRLMASDASWITLLQIPLLFYLVLNVALSGRTAFERLVRNQMWREQSALLEPYLNHGGKVLSVEINPLARRGMGIEVEPLIYTYCVRAGMVDPAPVRGDLERGAFSSVLLYQDVFADAEAGLGAEMPTLPDDHLDIIRASYRLVAHVGGPLAGGVYVYQPTRALLGQAGR